MSQQTNQPSGSAVPPENFGSPEEGPDGGGHASEETRNVAQHAADASENMAEAAKDEAHVVIDEAKDQMKNVMDQARDEVRREATSQQDRTVGLLTSLRDELSSMADGTDQAGIATHLARQASEQVGSTASWLGSKEPKALLDDVKRFARRRPAMFIGLALGAGVLAGRMTRGMIDEGRDSDGRDSDGGNGEGRGDSIRPPEDAETENRHRADTGVTP
jgi:hypothetical protein